MPSLAQLLATKIKESNLAVTVAAKKAGISFPSFYSALHGKSSPNARSVNKYAAFLGISAAEVQSASGKTAKAATGKKAAGKAKPAKATKAKAGKKAKSRGRRGRPPGSKNKASAKAASKVNSKAIAALASSFKKATILLTKAGKLLSKLA
jgi:hypothetical protein